MFKKIFLFSCISLFVFSVKVYALNYTVGQCFANIKSQNYKSAKKLGIKAVKAMPEDFGARLCLGIADNKLGLYRSAAKNFNIAIPLAKNKISSMLVFSLAGETFEYMGDEKTALSYDFKSLKLSKELKNKNFESASYNNIADIYKNDGKFRKSLVYFRKSLSFSGNKISEAITYGNIGLVYDKMGNFEKAAEYQKKALNINKKIGSKFGAAEDFLNLGGTYLHLHNYTEAKLYILKGLAIEKKIGNEKWVGSGYGYMADLYFREGHNAKAMNYYKKAYGMYSISGDSSGEKICLSMINKIKHNENPAIKECAGDINKGNFKFSLAVCKKAVDNNPGNFYAGFLYGKAYMGLKNYLKAAAEFKKTLPLATDIKRQQLIYNWIGGSYIASKNYKKALFYLGKSLGIAQKIKNVPDEMSNLALIRDIYFKEKNYKKDIYYSKEYLSLLHSKKAIALEYDEIGVLYYDIADYQKSIKYDKESLAINRGLKDFSGASLNVLNMGHAYIDLKRYNKAKIFLIKGLVLAKEAKDKYKTALGYLNMGYLYQDLNKGKKAVVYYKKAYRLYESVNDGISAKYCLLMIDKINNKQG